MDKGWGPPNGQGLGPPNPDLQMHKGWGPTLKDSLHDLQMDKGWGPNPSRLANGGGPKPFTTCKWTTVGQGLGPPGVPPITSTAFGQGLDPLNLSRFGVTPQINFTASTYVSKPTRRLVEDRQVNDSALRPRTYPNANLKFCLDKHWGLQTIERLSIFSQGTGNVSTDRNINDKPFVPECRLEQVLKFACTGIRGQRSKNP